MRACLVGFLLSFVVGCYEEQTFAPYDDSTVTFGFLGALNDAYAVIAENAPGASGGLPRRYLHFYERAGTRWNSVQRTEVVLAESTAALYDVDLDGEDAWVGVGIPTTRTGNASYVSIYQRGTPWREVQRLTEDGSTDSTRGPFYGNAVAVRGTLAAVGAPSWDLLANGTDVRNGAVFVYGRQGGEWVRRYQIAVARDHAQWTTAYQFGSDVALDGQTLVVTAAGVGRLYVYQLTGSDYTLEWETEDYDRADRHKVALSGSTLAMVNRATDAVVVYTRDGSGSWTETQRVRWDDRPRRPTAIGLSATGLVVAFAGAGYGATTGPDAVRVYERDASGQYGLLSEIEPEGKRQSPYLTAFPATGSLLVGRGDAAFFYVRN